MNVFQFWPDLLQGLQYTVLITGVAFLSGSIIAVFVTAARRSALAPVRWLGTAYVEIIRAIPPLPWLFLGFFALPMLGVTLTPVQAGVLVFSLIAGAYLTEIYRSGLRAVPDGQIEASQALGLGRMQAYVKVIVPQAIRTILPSAVAYLIGLLKDSALVSVIGVHDITAIALVENRQTGAGLTIFISAALLYLAMSIPIGIFGRWLGDRLKRSQPGGTSKAGRGKKKKVTT